jgi:tetratricopeptide (TPR) repeat protein
MKFVLFILSLLLLSTSAYTQTIFTFNDGEIESTVPLTPPLLTDVGEVMSDVSVQFALIQNSPTLGEYYFMVANSQYPFAVYLNTPESQYQGFDFSGDGVIDSAIPLDFGFRVIAPWVLTYVDEDTINTTDEVFIAYLDRAFEQFAGNDNPYNNGTHMELLQELFSNAGDLDSSNRDLLLALFNFYLFGNTLPQAALQNIEYIKSTCEERFDLSHAIFHLHRLESYISMGESEKAIKELEILLEMAPDFVPAQVYKWQLETDPAEKEIQYRYLKEKFPNHWIVVQI